MWNVPHLPFIPEQASTFAVEYDLIYWTIMALTIFFTVATCAAIAYFVAKYHHGSNADRSNPPATNHALEIAWSVIPLLMALVIFAWNAEMYVKMRVPPKNAMNIFVVGKQWMWHLQHPNGVRENNRLTVPIGVPIKLTMISQDVLHSFYVPQFRVKQDVIPGRYTMLWFEASKIGTYNLFCTEYCGTQHSEMGGYVRVVSQADYAKWLANGGDDSLPNATPVELGKAIWDRYSCGNCHGVKDTERGPSLIGMYGRKREFTDGTSAEADQVYVRDAVLYPYRKILKGYEQTMPEYSDLLNEDQVIQLSLYMKTMGETAKPAANTPAQGTNR